MNLWYSKWFSWRRVINRACGHIEECLSLQAFFLLPCTSFWASKSLNFLCKRRVFSRERYGPQVEIHRPDTAQFVAENIWHRARLCFSQTSVGLAINCFLWDKTRAPLPTVENHLMEGVVTLRPICSHDWLTALPPCVSLPLAVCLYSSVSLLYHFNPLAPQSV